MSPISRTSSAARETDIVGPTGDTLRESLIAFEDLCYIGDQIRRQTKAAVGPAKVPHTAAVCPILARADGARTYAARVFGGGPLAASLFSKVAK